NESYSTPLANPLFLPSLEAKPWAEMPLDEARGMNRQRSPGWRFAPSGLQKRRAQEGKVAALVGPQYLLGIKPGIAACGLLVGRRQLCQRRPQRGVVDQQSEAAVLHREADAVAIAPRGERPAGGGVWRHV